MVGTFFVGDNPFHSAILIITRWFSNGFFVLNAPFPPVYGSAVLLQRLCFKNWAKKFWAAHSDEVFTSLSAEDTDTQAVVFSIPEAVRSSLDELHFRWKPSGIPLFFEKRNIRAISSFHLSSALPERTATATQLSILPYPTGRA